MGRKIARMLITWAQLRFSIIGGLLASPPPKGQLRKELGFLASRRYRHPTEDRWVTFGASTIERWYYRALNSDDPVKALGRKVRSDAGKSLALNPRQLAKLKKQYAAYPHWSYQLHSDNLNALVREKPNLGSIVSYSSVRRGMKERGWTKKKSKRANQTQGQKRAAQRLEQLEVRSFESEYVNALWHLDFHETRMEFDVNGQLHKPVALCVLDDHSRLCCHLQWYLAETAEALIHGLTQAFHKRGLPRALMTDNGSAMIAHETKNGLSRLGVLHEKTLPYSPYQNGKQEAFWGQVEGRFISMLTRAESLTLAFLNRSCQAWAEMEYNRSRHEEINEPPLDRFISGKDVSRVSPDEERIRLAFSDLVQRKQRKSDGTIRLEGKRFEIPSRYRMLSKVHIRYQSWNLGMAYLVDQRTEEILARIYPQDKLKNASGHRRTLEPLSEESLPVVKEDSNPIPPLLRKYMADYAVTGLPPAYIPKEESKTLNSDKVKGE